MIYITDKSLKKLPYISTAKAGSFTATFGNSTFILNESSKHPNLTLKASSTSSISYSSNRPKHLINLDLSIVLIYLHIIIESCSRSSRLLIKTCVGKFSFFAT